MRELTIEAFEQMLELIYQTGGNPEFYMEDDVCYTDSYIDRTDHGDNVLMDCLPRSLRNLEQSLEGTWHEFDAIVVSGFSGVVPGAILAHKYQKQLVIVRKDEDECHGTRMEGRAHFAEGTPFIVLDDFIGSGKTMRRILDNLDVFDLGLPKYVVLYRGRPWHKEVSLTDGRIIKVHHVKRGLYALKFQTTKKRKLA